MSKPFVEPDTARLKARIPVHVYDQMSAPRACVE